MKELVTRLLNLPPNKKPVFKKVLIIINPAATRRKLKKVLKIIKKFFDTYKIDYEYWITKRPGDATKFAKRGVNLGYKLIIAAGGDGTVNEVMNGIINTPAVLGILPLGTVNILALETKIPLNITKALNLIFTGRIKKMDIGKVNDRYFLLMCGCGFDSYAIYKVNLQLKKFIGGIAYIVSAFNSVFKYKPSLMHINIDNHRIDEIGYFVIVENVSSYGGSFKLAPYANINDGLLDVCVFKKSGFWDLLRYSFGVAFGRHLDYPDVRYYKCRKVKVTASSNVLLHADGDLIGSLPASIEIKRGKLKLLVP